MVGPFLGWSCIAFFGLGIPASLLVKWSDIDAFRMASIRGAKMIAIDYSAEYTKQKAARAAASALAGMEGAIADHYSAPLEKVLQTLHEWKARHGGAI